MSTAPEGVTETAVEKIWQQHFNDPLLKLAKCSFSAVGNPGDYYSSIMHRVISQITINGQSMEKRMVIKMLPKGEAVLQYLHSNSIFEKETETLKNTVPKLQKILEDAGIISKLAAQVFYAQTDPMMIAMEDLEEQGFATTNKYIGLCLEECLQVVKSLAEFHAASIIYLKNDPSRVEYYKDFIWGAQNRESIDQNLNSALKTIIKYIDTWSETPWAEKLQKLKDKDYPQQLYNAFESNKTAPMVLNHGDLWHNNIMLRHTSLNGPEVRFVDLQQSWRNSPAFDLLCFIFTSPRPYVRFRHMDNILKTYLSRFHEVCKILNISVQYSYDDMMKDFTDNLIHGFVMFHYVFPIVTSPPNKELQNAKIGDDYMTDNPAFFNPTFQKIFLGGLPFFEKHGLI